MSSTDLIRVNENSRQEEFDEVLARFSWIGRSEANEAILNAIGQATNRERLTRPAGRSAVLRL